MKLYHAAEANRNGLYQYIETSWQSKIAAKNLLQLVMYMDDFLTTWTNWSFRFFGYRFSNSSSEYGSRAANVVMIKQTEEGGGKEGEMAGNSVRIESALSTNVK